MPVDYTDYTLETVNGIKGFIHENNFPSNDQFFLLITEKAVWLTIMVYKILIPAN